MLRHDFSLTLNKNLLGIHHYYIDLKNNFKQQVWRMSLNDNCVIMYQVCTSIKLQKTLMYK